MSYYTPTGTPGYGTAGASSPMRSEFTAIAAGFALLPSLPTTPGQLVVINQSGNAIVTSTQLTVDASGNLTTSANLTLSSGNLVITAGTLSVGGTTTHTGLVTLTGGATTANGNISITGSGQFSGPGTGLTGTAAALTVGSVSAASSSANAAYDLAFLNGSSLLYNANLNYNPSTGQLSVTGLAASSYALVLTGMNNASGWGLQVVGTYTGSGNSKLVSISDTGNTNGVNIQLIGNGSTNPNKYIRVNGGLFQILNSAYSASPLSMDDSGNLTLLGSGTFAGLTSSTTLSVGTTSTFSGVATFNAGAFTSRSAITAAATTTVNCNNSNYFYISMGTSITTLTVSNPGNGQAINVRFKQGSSGGPYTVAWPSSFRWNGGLAPVLSTAANAEDFLTAQYDNTDGTWVCSLLKGVQ